MTSFDDMRARLERDPTPWKPEKPGDSVLGTVVGIAEREGNYGPFLVYAIEDPDGVTEWEVSAGNGVLHQELEANRVQIGDRLGIKYLGEKQSGSGNTYKAWRVIKDPGPGDGSVAITVDRDTGEVLSTEPPPVTVPVAEAKNTLLAACNNDKSLAKELWGVRDSITEAELDALVEKAFERQSAEEAFPETFDGSPF